MLNKLNLFALVFAALSVSGCVRVVVEPTPTPQPTATETPLPTNTPPPPTNTPSPTPDPLATPIGAITWEGSLEFVGTEQTVCGTVESTFYAETTRGQPTFINIGKPYPEKAFTIIIWVDSRDNFVGPPEETYADKTVCVTGAVAEFDGEPQIEAEDPQQIEILE